MRRFLLLALALAGCATQPKLVMINPRTGATVACQSPDPRADSGAFLVSASRVCVSACQAHGFRPAPGIEATGAGPDIPTACTN